MNFFKFSSNSRGSILPGIVVAGLIIIGMFAAYTIQNNQKIESLNSNFANQTQEKKLTSSHMVIFGEWSDEKSVLKSYDLSDFSEYKVAELPLEIKKVTFIAPDKLLFINATNDKDHGRSIALYSIKDKKTTTFISADLGFGIDDYMISPNKQYISWWEVQLNPSTGTLLRGKSKVYASEINIPRKNLIISEDATDTSPIHYPKAVTNSARVFMDKFIPNFGAGWAYGMSVSNIDGTNLQEIANMQNGTYSTQPELSFDGRKLVFAGYDGTKGDGVELINGFRRALIIPNTIEVLDTTTLKREKLPAFSNSKLYPSVKWDNGKGNTIVYTALSLEDISAKDVNFYNLDSNNLRKVTLSKPKQKDLASLIKEKVLGETISENDSLISALDGDLILTGILNESDSSISNLGQVYSTTYDSFKVLNPETGETKSLGNFGDKKQIIALEKLDSIKKVDFELESSSSGEPIQVKTFNPVARSKSELDELRLIQQSDPESSSSGTPFCQDLAYEQCKSLVPEGAVTIVPRSEDSGGSRGGRGGRGPRNTISYKVDAQYEAKYRECAEKIRREERKSRTCQDSPLYIYGKENQTIKVKALTPIFNSSVPYSLEHGFDIKLSDNYGSMFVQGQAVDAIDYDYKVAKRKITQPKHGLVVPRDLLPKAISLISSNLGLNQKETEDLQDFASSRFSKPFVFISFFDHKTSSEILPLTFMPEPENYLNIVFYFKELDNRPQIIPDLPNYPPKLSRDGLTVVEISEFVDE